MNRNIADDWTDILLLAYRYLPGVPVAGAESLLLQEPEWAALIL
ncbi:hypothetical protein [Nitrosomonas marina]|nr:hypothetical protein [Nitrosomonas marina]